MHGTLLKEHSEYIGIATNNQAEYTALISALKSARDLGDELVCYLDSELVVKQMNREYKVSNPKMRTLWRQVVALKDNFEKNSFVYVPRTDSYIERIDRLANQKLDNRRSDMIYGVESPQEAIMKIKELLIEQ